MHISKKSILKWWRRIKQESKNLRNAPHHYEKPWFSAMWHFHFLNFLLPYITRSIATLRNFLKNLQSDQTLPWHCLHWTKTQWAFEITTCFQWPPHRQDLTNRNSHARSRADFVAAGFLRSESAPQRTHSLSGSRGRTPSWICRTQSYFWSASKQRSCGNGRWWWWEDAEDDDEDPVRRKCGSTPNW